MYTYIHTYLHTYIYIYTYIHSKIKTNLVYFIYLITTNLFRMAGKACHTHQVIVASDGSA